MLKRLFPPLPYLGRVPYIFLAYLGFFYLPYLFRPLSALDIAVGVLAPALFLPLFFSSFYRQGRTLWLHALGMTALGAALAPLNPGASVFFTYSACAGSGFERLREGFLLIAFNVLAAGLVALTLQPSSGFWIPALFFPAVVGVPVLYMSTVGHKQAQLLRKQEEVEHLAQIAERERIARDMHDVLGHTLSVIALKSELARKLLSRDAARAEEEIREVEDTAREALRQVREAIAGYRSAGLGFELVQARKALEAASVSLTCEQPPLSLSAPVENVLSLILREAVTNILRHARAGHCTIRLRQEGSEVHCEIRDDGIGLRNTGSGNGLRGMRERVQSLGGTLEISEADPGVRIALSLPLETH